MKKILTLSLMVIFALCFAAPVWAAVGETVVYPDEFPPKVLQTDGATLTNVLCPSGTESGGGKSPSLSGNSVTLNSGSVNYVMGAVNDIPLDTATITGNQAFIKGGTTKAAVGGYGRDCDVVSNSMTVSGGMVMNDGLAGGYTQNGNAMSNTVTITGGSMSWFFGGYCDGSGNAIGNTVNISGGSLNMAVAGGSSGTGNATGNTVAISGNPAFAAGYRIYGGITFVGDQFSGNTLKLGISITVSEVVNFENYEFRIPSSVGNGGTVIIVTIPVDLAGTNLDITGIGAGSGLRAGHTITLISNVVGVPNTINGTLYIPDTNIVTSRGTWKFSIAAGALTATAVSLPSGGGSGGGGGGCDAFGGFGIIMLAAFWGVRHCRGRRPRRPE